MSTQFSLRQYFLTLHYLWPYFGVNSFFFSVTLSHTVLLLLSLLLQSIQDQQLWESYLFPSLQVPLIISVRHTKNGRMFRTSCSACRFLMATCWSTGCWTSSGICGSLRGFAVPALLACTACAERNQILWDKLILRHMGVWAAAVKRLECQACQTKQYYLVSLKSFYQCSTNAGWLRKRNTTRLIYPLTMFKCINLSVNHTFNCLSTFASLLFTIRDIFMEISLESLECTICWFARCHYVT